MDGGGLVSHLISTIVDMHSLRVGGVMRAYRAHGLVQAAWTGITTPHTSNLYVLVLLDLMLETVF